jgi:O-antigen ligase
VQEKRPVSSRDRRAAHYPWFQSGTQAKKPRPPVAITPVVYIDAATMTIDRATKLAVLGWTAAALALQSSLVPGWRDALTLSILVFALAALLATITPWSVSAVLALAYVSPTIINLWHGSYYASFDVIWMSALFGAVAPRAFRTPWHLPGKWRAPLVAWALIVAISATIVACRELDFNLALLFHSRLPSEALGGVPRFTVGWVLEVATILVLGILWFDWLFGVSAIHFRHAIVAPLALSALAMCAVAIYQLFVDVTWLNQTVYGGFGRASGTLLDANVMGTLAALWIGGIAVYARGMKQRQWLALGLGVPAAWIAVWASGSRTAFGAAAVVTAFVLADFLTQSDRPGRRERQYLSAIVAAALAGLIVAAASGVVAGPLGRFRGMIEHGGSISGVMSELWNRNGYGHHAVEMISEHPAVGVGVGMFHELVSDYAAMDGDVATSDNAQNWYRHQLAEFGVVGSIAWIAWVVSFAVFVVRRHPHAKPGALTARGMLIAFGAISLVGMPGQLVVVVITFWTLACWFVRLAGDAEPGSRPGGRTWTVVAALCAIFFVGTLRLAWGDLRVPWREARMNRPFSYGFYAPESDGAGGTQRWARQRAAIVLDTPSDPLAITIGVNHFDIAEHPVEAKVWIDRRLVIDTVLDSTLPVSEKVDLPNDRSKVLLETWVSRVVHPRDLNIADDGELGLIVRWN